MAGDGSLETTASLLEEIRAGSSRARDRLVERYVGPLRRWARGRLPRRARDLTDTDDLVQITLMRALDHLEDFEYRKEGAFLAFLRRILQNAMRDEIRRAARKPGREALDERLPGSGPSPVEQAIGGEALARYERGLESLRPDQQEAVILRIELGFTYPEIAAATGAPSWNAARMKVSRALVRLAEVMHEG